MDAETQADVARALDRSITYVAKKEFARLSRGLSDRQIAKKIYRALISFRDLARNKKPCYNAWDSLFYLTWYQPSHVNLAYTLAQEVPRERNPFCIGRGRLKVVDFGSGALAMQFGLALAGAETLKKRGRCPEIAIVSTDESDHMRRIGKRMWRRFIEEIADEDKYPGLEDLQQVCSDMKIRKRHKRTVATRWLTALHVAYRENVDEVTDELDKLVDREPDAVLVTTRPEAIDWLYSLDNHSKYEGDEDSIDGEHLELNSGCFPQISAFRKHLYAEHIADLPDHVLDKVFSHKFLTRYPTTWSTPGFKSICRLYFRR